MKVVNAVFVINVNPLNPYTSTIVPIVSVNETKGSNNTAAIEANKNKLVEQTLLSHPDHKIISQMQVQIPNDSNKTTQQFIKDLGNEFLKEFLEKNFNINTLGNNSIGSIANLNGMSNSSNTTATTKSASTVNPMENLMNLSTVNNLSNMQPVNTLPSFGAPFWLQAQPSLGLTSDLNQGNVFNSNPFFSNQLGENSLNPKKLGSLESDKIPEIEVKNEQINDASVKRFRSGEDIFWDFDYDKSKKDLEDFIFKTQNAIKNNSYVESKN